MTIKALLLDLDGTLADSIPVMKLSYQRFMQQLKRIPTDEEFASLNGPPITEVIRQLKKKHSLNENEKALCQHIATIIDEVYSSVKPCIGAFDLLKKAKDYACTIGVVTSNNKQRAQAWLNNTGLSFAVDFIISGEDVKRGKPDPGPYLAAIKKITCPAENIIAIEDSLQGTHSAVSAGLKTWLLSTEECSSVYPGVKLISSLVQAQELLTAGV